MALKLPQKCIDLDETWNIRSLDHSAGIVMLDVGFSCAARAEIGAEGAKMDKNARGARIFGPIPMKLGTHDFYIMVHI